LIREDSFPSTVVMTAEDFPVAVDALRSRPPTAGTAHFPIARVVVSSTDVIIAVDSNTGPKVQFAAKINPGSHVKGSDYVDSYVTTTTGMKIAWRRDTACGCGSRLRTWRPFKNMGSSKDPTE